MIAAGNRVENIQNYINQGWITAYNANPNAELSVDYDITNPGKTTLFALLYSWAQARNPKPANHARDARTTPTLSWTPGAGAALHKVYFGTAPDNLTPVATQPRDANTYDPGTFAFGETLYWRVDECDNAGNLLSGGTGFVWTFTVAKYITVDDFEDYDDFCNRIFFTWLDGFGHNGDPDCGVPPFNGNGSGSTVGNLNPPFAEQTTVNSGSQSMPLGYNNSAAPFYSEAELPFAAPQDWTRRDVKSLTLYFHGDPCNVVEPLYVALQDNASQSTVVTHDNPAAVRLASWQEWNIDLSAAADAGVNLQAVKKLTIGIGDRLAPRQGGRGNLFIDDIRLYAPRCIPSFLKPAGDLTADCVVDYKDLQMMMHDWLLGDASIAAVEPNVPRAWYKLDETGAATDVRDASGNNNHATLYPFYQLGRNSWDPNGRDGGCLNFEADKAFGVTVPGAVFSGLAKGISICVWVNGADEQPREDVIFYGENAAGQRSILSRCPWSDGKVVFLAGNGTKVDWVQVQAEPEDYKGRWNHYAFVKNLNQGTQHIYLNGLPLGEISYATAPLAIDKFEIGWHLDKSKKYVGKLDDFRIYDYPLTQAEIASVMFESELYFPIESPANISDDESRGSKKVNFKDYTVLADMWLEDTLWP